MGQGSKIEWCDNTFNPWWGCVKVSPGCAHCYAETWASRYGHNVWGPAKTTARRMFGDKHWAEPLKWDKAAKQAGERKRVFCSSMADVFEDHPALESERLRLFNLIFQTGNLDWLLLTKRPENIIPMLKALHIRHGVTVWDVWQQGYFDHVWLGTSVEDQAAADARIPHLLQVPARVRFLSCEPLLGAVDLTRIKGGDDGIDALSPTLWEDEVSAWRDSGPNWEEDFRDWYGVDVYKTGPMTNKIDWIIAGGESGPNARPMHPAWVRGLRDQCESAGVPFFFKQWGEWRPQPIYSTDSRHSLVQLDGKDRGTPWAGWKLDQPNAEVMERVGKARAGCTLDGREWNEFPQ